MVYVNHNKEHLKEQQKQTKIEKLKANYLEQKEVKIICPFCKNISNAWSIYTHLRKSNKCIEIQQSFLTDNIDILAKLKNKVNNIKKAIKYKNVDGYESDISKIMNN